MEELIGKITEPNMAFVLCLVFIMGDVITGLLKAWKNKSLNSTIGRDGFIKKLGWVAGLILGYIVFLLTNINLMILLTAGTCIVTEFISILENFSELGIDLKKLGNYLEKVDSDKEKK